MALIRSLTRLFRFFNVIDMNLCAVLSRYPLGATNR